MRESLALGLRPRLVAGLLLTSAATLLAAALFLLPPLEHRLRSDQLASLAATAQAARASFVEIGRADARPGSRRLRRIAEALERRAGARAIVVDRTGRVLADSSPGPTASEAALSALRSGRTVRRISSSPDGPVAEVATPVTIAGVRSALMLRQPVQAVQSAAGVVRRAFTVAAMIGLAVALLVGMGIASTLSRRLRRLYEAVGRVGAGGLEQDVPNDDARDEVGTLTRAFAAMQGRLRRQEEARRAFVATASHELRTPIASLAALLELAEDDLHRDPPRLAEAADGVARARRQSERLAGLARDLLDLSRLDADVALRREPVDVAELCRAVASEFTDRARERRLALRLAAAAQRGRALADPVSVARIVRTLLENALQYTPADGSIGIGVADRGREVVVSVADSGPGVSREERELIFERFKRGSAGQGVAGFGLGLAIGRELARRMGGDLRLADATGGACFELALPIDAQLPVAAASADVARTA
jgi:signal transduction histidine kinase